MKHLTIKNTFGALGAVFFSSFFMQSASAAITFDSEDRYVRVAGSVSNPTYSESGNKQQNSLEQYGFFGANISDTKSAGNNNTTASANMTSNISQFGFTAQSSLSSSASATDGDGYNYRSDSDARSLYSITFTTDQAMYFNFSSSLYFNSLSDGNARGGATSYLKNAGYNSPAFNLSFGSNSNSSDFNQDVALSGLLQAGQYTFYAQATVDTDTYSSRPDESALAGFDISLTFSTTNNNWPNVIETPLPAGIWLFGSALALLAGRARFKA